MTTLPHDAMHAIATQDELEAALEAALQAIRGIVGDGAVFAAIPQGDAMQVALGVGTHDPRFFEMRPRPGRGLGGYVLDHGATAICDDYANDPRISHDFVDIVFGVEGLQSMVCVPVLVRDKPKGLLYAARRSGGRLESAAARHVEEAAGYAAIAIEHAERRRQAVELERLRDRQRLATSLHDSVAQMLFSIGVAARQSLVTGDQAALDAAMREIETTACAARREMRETLERLTAADEGLSLQARLEAEVRLFSRTSGCQARLVCSGTPRPLSTTVEELVVDGVVEALRNAVKHGGASLALAYLDYEPTCLKIAVQAEMDTGRPREAVGPGAGTGTGLSTLRQRAQRLGGRVDLVAGEAHGQVLRMVLPVVSPEL